MLVRPPVCWRVVCDAPAPGPPEPRSTTVEGMLIVRPILKVPASSLTTLLAPQASIADWIAEASSPPLGDKVAQMGQLALGMPPTEFNPGFHVVARSAGRMVTGPPGPVGPLEDTWQCSRALPPRPPGLPPPIFRESAAA